MKPLTPQQRRVLDLIRRQVAEQGYPPSVRDICRELGFRSTSTAHHYLEKLEEGGYIERAATARGQSEFSSQAVRCGSAAMLP